MRSLRVLVTLFMVALFMMLCGCLVGLCSILVVLSGLLVCVFWHVRDTSECLEATLFGKVSVRPWRALPRARFALLAVCAVMAFDVQLAAQNPEQALALQQSGDWAAAEAVWRQLTRAAPADYRYWTSLGACLAHQGRFEEAIEDYRKSLRLSPHDPQTNFNLGLACFKTGKLERAIQPLTVAEGALPQGAEQARLLLGMSYYGTGQAAKAIPYLERAAEHEPANAELQLTLARAYLQANAFDKAREQFVRMLSINSDSAQVHLLLAEAYDGLGKTEDALAEFRLAAGDGRTRGAHFGAGYLLLRDKHYDEAIAEFRQELTANPNGYAALGYLGDALLKAGNSQDAFSCLRASIAAEDKLWITHFDLGIIAETAKDYPGAINQFRQAITVNARRPEVHYRLAQAYAAVGQSAEAQAERRKVQALHAERNDDLVMKVSGNR